MKQPTIFGRTVGVSVCKAFPMNELRRDVIDPVVRQTVLRRSNRNHVNRQSDQEIDSVCGFI
ncbi:hypothetical protein J6590_045546 [Homalodisca vitripennis]|nr:hypothetical protein J6590_045546 [Homalodisca vitripennis]